MTSLCMAIRRVVPGDGTLNVDSESLGLEKRSFTNGAMSLDLDPLQREVHKVVFMFSCPLHEDRLLD